MTIDDKEIVSALRARLIERIGDDRFDLWFGNGTQLVPRPGTLLVEVPNSFYRDWLRSHFRGDLEAVCAEIFSDTMAVEFQVNEHLTVPEPSASKQPRTAQDDQPEGSVAGTIATAQSSRPIRRAWATFDELMVGTSNKLAATSAQLAVERPGTISPLLLHGPTGVGKSHLLEATLAGMQAAHPHTRTVYLTAEQFTSHFLEALSGRGLPSFRRKYRDMDLLVLDDIQFFAGKKATLVEVLHTVDQLLRQGRQIVLAADRPPAELPELGPELVARLSGGLVCGLELPDYATRLGIVARLSRQLEVSVPEDVQSLVASQVASHARELSGVLNRLQATSLAHGRPINRTLAEEVLSDMTAQASRFIRLPDIQKAVCDEFGILPDSLRSTRTARSVSNPRVLAMFLARKHTRAALSEISHYFGRRSHSTVISANKKVEAWMSRPETLLLGEKDCHVEEALRRVEQRLKIG